MQKKTFTTISFTTFLLHYSFICLMSTACWRSYFNGELGFHPWHLWLSKRLTLKLYTKWEFSLNSAAFDLSCCYTPFPYTPVTTRRSSTMATLVASTQSSVLSLQVIVRMKILSDNNHDLILFRWLLMSAVLMPEREMQTLDWEPSNVHIGFEDAWRNTRRHQRVNGK